MLSNTLGFRSAIIFLAALILPATAANGQQLPQRLMSKLDARLSSSVRARHTDTKRVIIRTTSDGIPRLTHALKGHRRSVRRHHSTINAVTAHVPAAELERLSELPFVESISEDAIVRAEQTFSDVSTLRGTLALPALSPNGYGVGIAVIDSGLEDGPEFAGRLAGFFDFTQEGVKWTAPTDGHGHGTHVAGLIAGNGAVSNQRYRGVAPKARLIVLKVLDENGAGYTSDVIEAIEFATRNRSWLGIDIINLSLGHPILEPAATDPLVQAVEAAVRAGIVVVTAAGNVGVSPSTGEPAYAGILSPGNAPSAITVGAARTFDTNVRGDDRIANYSSRGPTWYDARAKPDLVAPGHGLVAAAAKSSALYVNHPALRVDDAYVRLNGTSMASAVVSGTVALMLQGNRRLTPNAVKAILQFTALPVLDDQGARYDVLTQGTGSVNPAGAIEMATHIDSRKAVSSWWLTSTLDPWTVIDGQAVSWAESIVWSDAVSFGPVVSVNQPAWAENIVWGSGDNIVWGSSDSVGGSSDSGVWGNSDNIVWGSNIVWGNNIVWSGDDNIVWGSNIVWGNALLGSIYGTSITWGMAVDDPSQTVWGTLDGGAGSHGLVLTSPSP